MRLWYLSVSKARVTLRQGSMWWAAHFGKMVFQSKVAMRSSGRTKSGDPSFVTRSTKPMMAFFVWPSFHDRNGSAARTFNGSAKTAITVSVARLADFSFCALSWGTPCTSCQTSFQFFRTAPISCCHCRLPRFGEPPELRLLRSCRASGSAGIL